VDTYFQNTLLEKAQYHKQILWGNIKSDRLHVLSDDAFSFEQVFNTSKLNVHEVFSVYIWTLDYPLSKTASGDPTVSR